MSEQNPTKTNINWFPGHMTKAIREIEARIHQVDCIIELRDARAVESSHNPLIDELRGNRPYLIVLTKKDKADSQITEQWLQFFTQQNQIAISVNLMKDNITAKVEKEVLLLMKEKHEKQLSRGIRPRAVRALVFGIPNVGKSTFINRMQQKGSLQTGNQPGVTRSLKNIKISSQLELVDSPGLLWPKFENQMTGFHLALTNSIAERVLPLDDIIHYAYRNLAEFPAFRAYYSFNFQNEKEFIQHFAQKRGYYLSKEQYDYELAKKMFLKEVQDGKIMRYSWEKPNESI